MHLSAIDSSVKQKETLEIYMAEPPPGEDRRRGNKRKRDEDEEDDAQSELALLTRRVADLLRPAEEFPRTEGPRIESVERRIQGRRGATPDDEYESRERQRQKRTFTENLASLDVENELARSMLRLTLRKSADDDPDVQRQRIKVLDRAVEAWAEVDARANATTRALWKSAARLEPDVSLDTLPERRIFFRNVMLRFLSEQKNRVIEAQILSSMSRMWLAMPSAVQEIILSAMPLHQRVAFFVRALEAFTLEHPNTGFAALRERAIQEWLRCVRPANVDYAPPSFDLDALVADVKQASLVFMPASHEPIFELGDSVWEWLYYTGRFGATEHIEIPLVRRVLTTIYRDAPSMVMSLAWAWILTHRWPRDRAMFELKARGVNVDSPFIQRLLQ